MALTGKQKLFIEEYLQCCNATEAARRAGYSGDDNALAVTGHKNLRNAKIFEEIKDRLDTFAMTTNEILMRLASVARGEKPTSWNKITLEGDEGAIPALSENFNPMVGLNALIKLHDLQPPSVIQFDLKPMTWKETIEAARADDDEK